MMSFTDDSIQILKNKGFKLTGSRVAVLRVLEKAKTPLSPYDIEEGVPEEIPINVVTVYRVLSLFETIGIVHRLHTKHGYVRCDFKKKPDCHHFAICESCDGFSEFLIDKNHSIEHNLPQNFSYKNLKHIAEVSGTCPKCS